MYKVQLTYKQSFEGGGSFFKGSKKRFGCFGTGQHGKACQPLGLKGWLNMKSKTYFNIKAA